MKPNWISVFCWGMMGVILGSISGFTWWHWLAMIVVMAVNDNSIEEQFKGKK